MRNVVIGVFVAVLSLAVLPNNSQAQGFAGGEIERALRPGVYVPYDGAGFSHRYNYELGPAFYFNFNAGNLAYYDYLDRLDRAEKFGHLWPSSKYGHGYQIERIHREYWKNAHLYDSGHIIIIKRKAGPDSEPKPIEKLELPAEAVELPTDEDVKKE